VTPMRVDDHIGHVADAGERLAAAVDRTSPGTPEPSCPGWTVDELVRHVGGVHRWATATLAQRRAAPFPPAEQEAFFEAAPHERDALLAWFRNGCAGLLHVLSTAPIDTECWAFLPAPSPLGFWARRQAHETTVHRVDAELAAGDSSAVDADLAADGVDELLTGFLARARGRLVADPPRTLVVRSADTGHGWRIRIEPDRRVVERIGQRTGEPADDPMADCALTGPAADLYLLLWNRRGPEAVEVSGDRAVLDLWRRAAVIRWG